MNKQGLWCQIQGWRDWGWGCGASCATGRTGLGESVGFSAEELSNQMCHLEEPFRGGLGGGESAVGRPGGGCPVSPLEGV